MVGASLTRPTETATKKSDNIAGNNVSRVVQVYRIGARSTRTPLLVTNEQTNTATSLNNRTQKANPTPDTFGPPYRPMETTQSVQSSEEYTISVKLVASNPLPLLFRQSKFIFDIVRRTVRAADYAIPLRKNIATRTVATTGQIKRTASVTFVVTQRKSIQSAVEERENT